MRTLRISSMMVFSLFLLCSVAFAQPKVEIKIAAEKEMTVVKNGQKTKKMVPVKKVTSGDIVQYTLSYVNNGNEEAKNVVINDPIPEGMAYIQGSAVEKGELTFSVDGGKTFKKPSLLTYEMKSKGGVVEKRVATPEQYSHIQWVIDKILPGEKGKVSFSVKVK